MGGWRISMPFSNSAIRWGCNVTFKCHYSRLGSLGLEWALLWLQEVEICLLFRSFVGDNGNAETLSTWSPGDISEHSSQSLRNTGDIALITIDLHVWMERQICTQYSSQIWVLMWSSMVLGWVRETLSIWRCSGIIGEGTKQQYWPLVGICIAGETGFNSSEGTSSFFWSMQTSETGPNLQILGMGHQRHGKLFITRNFQVLGRCICGNKCLPVLKEVSPLVGARLGDSCGG